ncbi:MAG: hypothetical protein GXO64_04905 [Candidatus Micrarchaeota archaeon]|nr:hypothetical protein [Candidatus Micrarchaeota archaeon]
MTSKHILTVPFDGYEIEVHAFSENGPNSDKGLAKALHEARYNVLANGQPIYCTAVTPDFDKKEERNPHDELDSTRHVVLLINNKKNNKIGYGASAAISTGETYRGEIIGVPLENRYQPEGSNPLNYPEGASMDDFRKFVKRTYGTDENIIAEIYRHFENPMLRDEIKEIRKKGGPRPEALRLLVYAGLYKDLVVDRENKGDMPVWLWVYDAIARYADKYSKVGGSFRDFVHKKGLWIPTALSKVRKGEPDGEGVDQWYLKGVNDDLDGTLVSRLLEIFYPAENFNETGRGEIRKAAMLDGVVGIKEDENKIKHPLSFLFGGKYNGFMDKNEKTQMLGALNVVGGKFNRSLISDVIVGKKAKKRLGIPEINYM